MWKDKILSKWTNLNKKGKVIVLAVAVVVLYIVIKGI
jgi:hypothetical protein|tara:strand:+ start:702 stop:812 length:111 start_codon:yes stop_codon:yes gene_type:complete